MNLLLDTHAFLWFMEGSERISHRAREEIEAAFGVRALSVASAWEMAIKTSLGKLTLASRSTSCFRLFWLTPESNYVSGARSPFLKAGSADAIVDA